MLIQCNLKSYLQEKISSTYLKGQMRWLGKGKNVLPTPNYLFLEEYILIIHTLV